ncbi:hypothetical protein BD289DRAFT_88293 [Coniella lustricola]|uniref:Uncharacterized protein n=1 Tax=Coniella lustricola TaxID=2025994 RepID=A0A2T2ZYN3_9PEZI|nr:hypothetical protein BD289DRAFT_88293 [Coniella lustricola]
MKSIFLLACSLSAAFASPVLSEPHQLALRDTAASLDALLATVKTHTGNINQTLASLSTATNATAANSTTNGNVQTEFKAIADALNSSSTSIAASTATTTPTTTRKRSVPLFGRTTDCDATCQENVYSDFDSLSAELSYTMEACINKNAVGKFYITSSTSVLLTVVLALADLTNTCETVTGGIAGLVVQNLEAAMGLEVGGILATLITAPAGIVTSK